MGVPILTNQHSGPSITPVHSGNTRTNRNPTRLFNTTSSTSTNRSNTQRDLDIMQSLRNITIRQQSQYPMNTINLTELQQSTPNQPPHTNLNTQSIPQQPILTTGIPLSSRFKSHGIPTTIVPSSPKSKTSWIQFPVDEHPIKYLIKTYSLNRGLRRVVDVGEEKDERRVRQRQGDGGRDGWRSDLHGRNLDDEESVRSRRRLRRPNFTSNDYSNRGEARRSTENQRNDVLPAVDFFNWDESRRGLEQIHTEDITSADYSNWGEARRSTENQRNDVLPAVDFFNWGESRRGIEQIHTEDITSEDYSNWGEARRTEYQFRHSAYLENIEGEADGASTPSVSRLTYTNNESSAESTDDEISRIQTDLLNPEVRETITQRRAYLQSSTDGVSELLSPEVRETITQRRAYPRPSIDRVLLSPEVREIIAQRRLTAAAHPRSSTDRVSELLSRIEATADTTQSSNDDEITIADTFSPEVIETLSQRRRRAAQSAIRHPTTEQQIEFTPIPDISAPLSFNRPRRLDEAIARSQRRWRAEEEAEGRAWDSFYYREESLSPTGINPSGSGSELIDRIERIRLRNSLTDTNNPMSREYRAARESFREQMQTRAASSRVPTNRGIFNRMERLDRFTRSRAELDDDSSNDSVDNARHRWRDIFGDE